MNFKQFLESNEIELDLEKVGLTCIYSLEFNPSTLKTLTNSKSMPNIEYNTKDLTRYNYYKPISSILTNEFYEEVCKK